MFKLTYFNLKARMEVTRMLLAAAKVEFKDDRIEFADWPALKPTIPSGQLPVVVTPEGKTITQSMAIARYVAKRFGFYSENDWEVYLIEATVSLYSEIMDEMFKIHFCSVPATQAELLSAFKTGKIPTVLKQIDQILEQESKGGFIAGGKNPTLGDVFLVCIHDMMEPKYGEEVAHFPKILAHKDKVLGALPHLVEYLKKRPATDI